MTSLVRFNAPPGWPRPPKDWIPDRSFKPSDDWPDPPHGWVFFVSAETGLPAEMPQEFADTPWNPQTFGNPPPTTTEISARDDGPPLPPGSTETQPIEMRDEVLLQEAGLYSYHHPLEDADAYKIELASLSAKMKDLVRSHQAVRASDQFRFENSLARGRKLSRDLGLLMLRAYNAEAENIVRSLRSGSSDSAKRRLAASARIIHRLGSLMEISIADEYHALRIREIELTADHQEKLKEQRIEAQEERTRLREERIAQRELREERERIDKERAHVCNALERIEKDGLPADPQLESRLEELDAAIARNDYRAANIRAGYVYVISNIGVFGPDTVKIGLTRRLDPMDRVRELGDASVPFPFDVHALFFSEDAVGLEARLHRRFEDRRVNHVNRRREFFFATANDVHEALIEEVGNLLEFAEAPDAEQFWQSTRYWPSGVRASHVGLSAGGSTATKSASAFQQVNGLER